MPFKSIREDVAGSGVEESFVDDVFKNLTSLRFAFLLPWLIFGAMQPAICTEVVLGLRFACLLPWLIFCAMQSAMCTDVVLG